MSGVVVLGAGLAGLGFARSFNGARVFEQHAHPGGHAYSHDLNGWSWDEGAHICHSQNHKYLDVIQSRSQQLNTISESCVKNVWQKHWYTYPVQNHLRELPVEARIQALTDLVIAQQHQHGTSQHYEEWCHRQYGSFLTEHFYRVYTNKYWRTEMNAMATDWLGGRLIPAQMRTVIEGAFRERVETQTAFNRFLYPVDGGYFSLYRHLYEDLNITYRKKVVSLDVSSHQVTFEDGTSEHYRILISTLPLDSLIAMCAASRATPPTPIITAADELIATKILCVNLTLDFTDLTPAHWFYIYDDDIPPARVSVPSSLAGSKDGKTRLQAEVFFGADEAIEADRICDLTTKSLAKLLGFDPSKDIAAVNSFSVAKSYVVPTAKRAEAVACIQQWLEAKHVLSIGLYGRWKYVWSDAAYLDGVDTARRVSESL